MLQAARLHRGALWTGHEVEFITGVFHELRAVTAGNKKILRSPLPLGSICKAMAV